MAPSRDAAKLPGPRGQLLEEGGDAPKQGRENAAGIPGQQPDVPEELVEETIAFLGKCDLRQEAIDRNREGRRNPPERADGGGMETAFVLAERVGPQRRPPRELPLGEVATIADLSQSSPEGPVEGLGLSVES